MKIHIKTGIPSTTEVDLLKCCFIQHQTQIFLKTQTRGTPQNLKLACRNRTLKQVFRNEVH